MYGLGGGGYRENKDIKVRCETNIYTLYRGTAEIDLELLDDRWAFNGLGSFGAKVSPTTDLRGSSNNNNPDNSALTGGSLGWHGSSGKHWKVRISLVLLIVLFS